MKYEKFINLCFKTLVKNYKIDKEQFTLNAVWHDEESKRVIFLDMEKDCLYMCHCSNKTGNKILVAKFKMCDKLIIEM